MTTTHDNIETDLDDLVSCLVAGFGNEVGSAVKEKFDEVLALEGVDLNAIQGQITQLNALLAANTGNDSLTAQSLLAQLHSVDSRLDALEGSTAVADLAAVVAALQIALTAETAARISGDQTNATAIATVESALALLTAQVVAIQTNGGGSDPACDCVALTAAIADQANAITNLSASDAAQSVQIAALQATIAGLQTDAVAIAAAQATANAAQTAANTALANAAVAKAAADAAAAAVAALKVDTDNDRDENEHQHSHHITKEHVRAINCNAKIAQFRTILRGHLFA